ncbi:MAG: precorrin-6A/cobalt-precorrin-6A reductase [Cyanobacteria bacterium K_Offshore_surface_m2_239]|nr:precorrin-6A/cobalt-precorrin-6A reductase [Cyanobacteria bacterium K_Offshore_surface_m2_239]
MEPTPILKHAPPAAAPASVSGFVSGLPREAARPERLWLISGTGEGPGLARELLDRGWRLRVSVVSPEARLAYPKAPGLEVVVGALEGAGAWRAALDAARDEGDPFLWLLDASHPFATRVSATVAEACQGRPETLLRLRRPLLAAPGATTLPDLQHLADHLAPGERLLLAIGARHLATAIAHSPLACHHSRVLPHPRALREALRAGLPPHRVACVHPTADGAVERALCQRWGIDAILCRQSGSRAEGVWLSLHETLGLRLLLLRRPPDPPGVAGLLPPELLARVGWPGSAENGGNASSPWSP